MTIKEAIKEEKAIEVEQDLYLLDDGRIAKYDRYIKGACKWVCDDGYIYRNFCEMYNKNHLFAKELRRTA